MTDSVASLVARVVTDDDRTAFELLVRRYRSPLRNFLRRLACNDLKRADELAREAFMKLYRSIDAYRGQAVFAAWLYCIVYGVFLEDERKRAGTGDIETRAGLAADANQWASAETDVDAALSLLSIPQRAAFDLHYKKRLTAREASDALELPLEAVEAELTSGRGRLKELLEDRGRDRTGDSADFKIDAALSMPEAVIADDGFSDAVMDGLPRKRLGSTNVRRWTLGLAAAIGSFVASLLSAPIESVFSAFVLERGYETEILGASLVFLFFGLLAIPVAWAFFSK